MDAMTSHRPYRPGLPRQNAIDELIKGKGIKYDPKPTETLIRIMHLNDRRILVVDDDKSVLEALVEELKTDGLDAIGYSEPALALRDYAQKPFPLVITALKMTDMDGARLAKRVKEIDSNTEVIVITKYGGKEDALRALRAGASDFLEKPLDSLTFRKSVNRALQRYMGKIL